MLIFGLLLLFVLLWGIFILISAGAEMQICLLIDILFEIYVCRVFIFLNVLILHSRPPTEHFYSVIPANIQRHHLHKEGFGIKKKKQN